MRGGERGRVSGRASIHERENARGNENYRSLLQNVVSIIGLFCKRDLSTRPICETYPARARAHAQKEVSDKESMWQNDRERDGEREKVIQIACVA